VFGSHRTYYVTNGSSMSNRVILMASVTRGQVALCDRNCHKSVEHAMTMSGASPVYLVPSRNALGLIGPIPPGGSPPRRSASASPTTRCSAPTSTAIRSTR
jgi:arginine/lysine/ornithine decarboxylase